MTTTGPTVEDHLATIATSARHLAASARDAGTDARASRPAPGGPCVSSSPTRAWSTGGPRRSSGARTSPRSVRSPSRPRGSPTPTRRPGSRPARPTSCALSRTPPTTSWPRPSSSGRPAPRRFWARRQAHETTVHALDALSATTDRPLTAGDLWLADAEALDGVDELLVGFWQRRKGGPRADPPATTVVEATTGDRWLVDAGPERARTRRLDADATTSPAAPRRSGARPPTSTSPCGTAAGRSTTPPGSSRSGTRRVPSPGDRRAPPWSAPWP